MLADHDFDVDAEVVFCAENFDDASAWLLRGAGPVGDFYVDDYAFQILPVGVDLCFVTDDSVWDFFFCGVGDSVGEIFTTGALGTRGTAASPSLAG